MKDSLLSLKDSKESFMALHAAEVSRSSPAERALESRIPMASEVIRTSTHVSLPASLWLLLNHLVSRVIASPPREICNDLTRFLGAQGKSIESAEHAHEHAGVVGLVEVGGRTVDHG